MVSSHLVSTSATDETALDAHPLIRAYFARQLQEHRPDAWRAAHGRLFEHLQAKAEHHPDTLEGLQPLYQAVRHGCQAGRQQEACVKVYRDRILRGTGNDGFYSWKKLGANGADLGAVACFFESPWRRVALSLTMDAQAWLLNEAANRLRALGRLTEALEPIRAGLPMAVKREDWTNAAVGTSNLSELELTLGDLPGALRDAEQSVASADRSGDASQRIVCRTTLADALHQAGRRADALARLREAEAMQTGHQPAYPLLCSQAGFRYCDLLLAGAERAAWRAFCAAGRPAGGAGGGPDGAAAGGWVETLRDVEQRAEGTQRAWREIFSNDPSVLDIALDHLTLGRVGLYRAILERPDASDVLPASASLAPETEIEQAVDGLRRAGQLDDLPRGLLTRAWLRALTGNAVGARTNLDEAWEIAERGPMPLFQADVYLHRARLLRDGDALAAARKLIEKHGYARRLDELADAEAAASGW